MDRRLLFRALGLLIASVAMFMLHNVINKNVGRADSSNNTRIQQTILSHQQKMEEVLQKMSDSLVNCAQTDTLKLINTIGSESNYSFYLFEKNDLVAWYNALLPIANLRPSQLNNSIMRTDNGWYFIVKKKVSHSTSIFALFRIKSRYPVSNDYLKDELDPSFGIDGRTTITIDSKRTENAITDANGKYLFSISCENIQILSTWQLVADGIVLLLWLLLIIFAAGTFVVAIRKRGIRNRALIVLAIAQVGIYVWTLFLQLSVQMSEWFLFSPQIFAYDWWAPSLFYLMLAALLSFIWCYFLFLYFDFEKIVNLKFARKHISLCTLCMIILLYVIFIIINVAVNIMVYNSTDLAVYVGDLDISGTTIVKLFILSLFSLSFILVLERVYAEIVGRVSMLKYIIIMLLFAIIILLPTAIILPWFDKTFYLGFLIINPVYFLFKRSFVDGHNNALHQSIGMRYSVFVWLMFMVAFFVTQRLTNLNTAKEYNNRDLLLNNISFNLIREDDPVAETLLKTMEHNIASDTLLHQLFGRKNVDVNLYSYMRERYFDGYFTRYDLQVVPCIGPDSYIQESATGEEYNCYSYFENMINIFGKRIAPKSKFYRLNDNDGSPSYFGTFSFYNRQAVVWYRIHIEINQKQQKIEAGYPELLTNSRDRIDTRMLKGYSYAKYIGNALQITNGTFSYPLYNNWLGSLETGQKKHIRTDNYSHSIYAVTDNQTIVLSYPSMTLRQYMADYSYIFLSMFIISTIILSIVGLKHSLLYYNMSIHERIQSSFVLFVMVLLIIICFISAWESMQSFERQSTRRLNNNLSVVKSAVVQGVEQMQNYALTSLDADNILHRATQDIVADAHLYSPDGYLIGTSKRELFDNGIASPLINSDALQLLRNGNDVSMKENIGQMEYFAVYSPVTDMNSRLIGYLSVPYFNDVNAMRTQLKSTIVPITTAYMIVILLAVLFSYFLAKGISKPLQAVSQKLRMVGLQQKNDHINYPHSDEIGLLVSEYNRMIDELEHSAEQLAQSERENTWREMARQIAHEIKNPLTPMKLSVQYMIKAWEKMDTEKFDEYIRRTANTLVEQIDHLAFVASEFSNLAKTTQQAEVSKVDVIEKLQNSVLLYSRTEDATISINTDVQHAYIMVNAEQIMSVFNNLIKNALQSVPQGQHVSIAVSAKINADNILITITDNGRGIAPEVREKIFKPNFTTKSTGMGLGLAIVKTIVNNAHGDIWFETEEGRGTTFFVSIPMVK